MNPTIRRHLQKLFQERVRLNAPIGPLTSLRIGGFSDAVVYPVSRDELIQLVELCKEWELPYRVVGGGTNLLASDRGFRGVLMVTTQMTNFRLERGEQEPWLLWSEPGVRLSRILSFCIKEGLRGLEFAAGIPGTFGGGVWMNAGTHLGCFEQVFHSMEVLTPNGCLKFIDEENAQFAYRSCGLSREYAILNARVKVEPANPDEVAAKVAQVKTFRSNQPLDLPSAGSVFKNPPGDFAGRLIESCGLKGIRCGDAMVSDKHANFIVNTGKATATDVIFLIEKIRRQVLKKTGVQLETELEMLS